jgi:hypothetical protein
MQEDSDILAAVSRAIAPIHRDIGELRGEVRGTLDQLTRRFDAAEEAARISRSGMHRLLDEHGERLAVVETKVERVVTFVDRAVIIEAQGKTIVKVTGWLGARALRILRWGLGLAALGLVATWRDILAALHLGPPPSP